MLDTETLTLTLLRLRELAPDDDAYEAAVERLADMAQGGEDGEGVELATTGEVRAFSSTQFNLADAGYSRSQGSPLPALQALTDSIADEDLAVDGREETPHITVKYGLHTNDAEDVRFVVDGFGVVVVRLGSVSIFPASESGKDDVVKVDVDGDDLRKLNALVASSLETTDAHPKYQPHITLAYVKPGTGKKYIGKSGLEGQQVSFSRLVFSDHDGRTTELNLMGSNTPDAGDDSADALELARWYVDLLDALDAAGDSSAADEFADAAESELDGSGWTLAQDRQGRWHAVESAEDRGEVELSAIPGDWWELAATGERAPKGGITITGKQYKGGQFIPAAAIANASPEDREKLDQAKKVAEEKASAKSAERKAKPVDRAGLSDRLSKATGGRKLLPSQEKSARASWRMLQRFHGDEALHRVQEIADAAEKALAKLDKEHPAAVRLRQRLGELAWMAGQTEAPAGKAEAPVPDESKTEEGAAPFDGSKVKPVELTRDEIRKLLAEPGDRYKDEGIGKTELKGQHRESGDPIFGYPYSPHVFHKSHATGRPIRHYVKLPDGQIVHPDELRDAIKRGRVKIKATPQELEKQERAKDWREAIRKTHLHTREQLIGKANAAGVSTAERAEVTREHAADVGRAVAKGDYVPEEVLADVKFTGTDAQGREWRNGELVAKDVQPAATADPSAKLMRADRKHAETIAKLAAKGDRAGIKSYINDEIGTVSSMEIQDAYNISDLGNMTDEEMQALASGKRAADKPRKPSELPLQGFEKPTQKPQETANEFPTDPEWVSSGVGKYYWSDMVSHDLLQHPIFKGKWKDEASGVIDAAKKKMERSRSESEAKSIRDAMFARLNELADVQQSAGDATPGKSTTPDEPVTPAPTASSPADTTEEEKPQNNLTTPVDRQGDAAYAAGGVEKPPAGETKMTQELPDFARETLDSVRKVSPSATVAIGDDGRVAVTTPGMPFSSLSGAVYGSLVQKGGYKYDASEGDTHYYKKVSPAPQPVKPAIPAPQAKPAASNYTAVGGNTFPVKDELKRLGARWDKDRKVWLVPEHLAQQAAEIVRRGPQSSGGGSGGADSEKARLRREIEWHEDNDNFDKVRKLEALFRAKYREEP